MDSCLSKPVTLDVLKQTLSIYADRVRKRGHKKARKGLYFTLSPWRGHQNAHPSGSILIRRAQRHGGEIVQQRDIVVHAQFHHG